MISRAKARVTCLSLIFLVSQPSFAQENAEQAELEKLLCSATISTPLLELVDAIGGVAEKTNGTYKMMSEGQKERFSDLNEAGINLSAAAQTYRTAFLAGCFSS